MLAIFSLGTCRGKNRYSTEKEDSCSLERMGETFHPLESTEGVEV